MPHATEGDLHAHLDGALAAIDPGKARDLSAHLARCADCAARLEAERAIRGRANELLEIALPAETPPPFSAVRGGAGAPRWGPERVAWAAGVVLALGAGWMGHALLRGTGDALDTAAAARSEQLAIGREALAQRADDDAPAEMQAAAETEAPARTSADEDVAASGTVVREEVAASEPGRGAGARAVDAETESPPAAAALRDVAEPSARVAAPSSEAMWRVTDIEEATTWGGRAPLVVPGLDVIDVAVADSGGTRLVRIRQALGDGATLEIVQGGALAAAETREADASAAGAAKAEAGRSQIRTVIDGLTVRASAPLAQDSLTALISRARPPDP